MTPPAESLRPALIRVLLIVTLALVVSAAFLQVATFAFVNYDDDDYVYENPIVSQGVTLTSLARAVTSFHAANWHPLTWASHMIDVQLFGMDAGAHHLVNVLLHLANVVLIFLGLEWLTGCRWRSAIVAAVFAVHPLNVESVAWISERKSLLSTLAWLLALGAYVAWTRHRRPRRYLLLVLAFVAALLSKPMAVTLPATLLILDVWPLGRLDFTLRGARTLILEKVPLFALSLVSSAITYLGQSQAEAVGRIPTAERLLNAADAYAWYLQKALIPTSLAVLYPHPFTLGEQVSRPAALICLILIAASIAVGIAAARRLPVVTASLAWYAITLLPVIGIIQVGSQSHADRYAYVPLLGIFVGTVWIVAELSQRYRLQQPVFAGTCAIVVALAAGAHAQARVWRDSATLFRHAIEVSGGRNPIARNNLASHYTGLGEAGKAAGQFEEALRDFRAAAMWQPDARALYNEAAVLTDLRRFNEAAALYRESLALDPANADGWLNLGDAQVMTGAYPEATTSYQRVLALRDDKYAHYGLAFACARLGHEECRVRALGVVQARDPELAAALLTQLGVR